VKNERPRNLAASVRQRLFNRAQARGEDFGLVLTKYGLERLLYRLSKSKHSGLFILKGALLFELWTHRPYRPTRDLDLLSKGQIDVARFETIFVDICGLAVVEDGLVFLSKSVRGEQIKEDQAYEGVRVHLEARLENARITMQVDIGFGDVVTPGPIPVQYPSLLELPAPKLSAYPRESVVAEKFEAMVKLGIANSRMKDFYDVHSLSQLFEFDGRSLCAAIKATFRRRGTALPKAMPLSLSAEFYEDLRKIRQWEAFLRKGSLRNTLTLGQMAVEIGEFLMPPTIALAQDEQFRMFWPKHGPWKGPN